MRPLRAQGIDVVTPDIPGFTALDPRQPNRWQDWVDAAIAAVERVAKPHQPVVLGGLCIGGVLAAAVALRMQHRVSGVAMLSPTLVYDGWGLSPWRHLRHLGYALGFGRLISIRERPPYGVKNPVIRKWVERELRERAMSPVGPASLPLWALREGERLMADVSDTLECVDPAPLLVLHAREDELCRVESLDAKMQRWPLRDKRLVVLENSYHMITIDNDRGRVADELVHFARSVAPCDALGAAVRASTDIPATIAA